jgi:hypothetical protein
MKMFRKGSTRVEVMKRVMKALKCPEVYKTIPYKTQDEAKIKQFIYPYLLKEVESIYHDINKNQQMCATRKGKKNLLWEGNVNTTINHIKLFGTNHRPDFVFKFNPSTKIAIEIKNGSSGSELREGIGQAIVFSTYYEFVSLLFIDSSKDSHIRESLSGKAEQKLIASLWKNYNIWFDII